MSDETKRNNFGVLSKDYDAARRGYPAAVFRYLKRLASDKQVKTLDIGCGTGISTRQLHEHGFHVVGADKDAAMVKVARSKRDNISYVIAPTHKLPFKDGSFNIVTAFTAFHWFTDKKSVAEIKRVLKSGGLFFAVWKKPAKSKSERLKKLGRGYKRVLGKYFKTNADGAKNYKPEKTFKANGFIGIGAKSFYFSERYTLADAMTLVKSISNWNLLPVGAKQKFYNDIENLYKKYLIDGFVVKNREVKVVAGKTPKNLSS